MNTNISVSLIMPVYNQELFIDAAINSILSQSFNDFELIIINDGSTDNSLASISLFKDPRIVVYNFSIREGKWERFNFGISQAKGKLIACMNVEDVLLPRWLEYQINFFNQNKDCEISCTAISLIDEYKNEVASEYLGLNHDEIKIGLLFGIPIISPTLMIKSEILMQNSILYKKDYEGYEDYKMLIELTKKYKLANLSEILLKQRARAVENIKSPSQQAILEKILIEQLNVLGIEPSQLELQIHLFFFFQFKAGSLEVLRPQNIISWFKKLNQANEKSFIYNNEQFKKNCLIRLDRILSIVSLA